MLAVNRYGSNADLILAACRLGHIRAGDQILDLTFGLGVWWKKFDLRHFTFVSNDLDPAVAAFAHHDATDLPADWGDSFDVVCWDPPYKLHGTPSQPDKRYGLNEYMPMDARHQMMRDGLKEAIRVAAVGGKILVKCQDQVCSGEIQWQTLMMAETAAFSGAFQIERLDMAGGRPQPDRSRRACLVCGKGPVPLSHRCRRTAAWEAENPGAARFFEQRSPQQHAQQRPSSLLIFQKKVSL